MGSHQAASSSNVISNRGLIAARKRQARECRLSLSLSLFFCERRAPSMLSCRAEGGGGGAEGRKGGKKEGRGTPRVPGGQWALPSLPPSLCPLPAIAVRTIELFFRADFRRSSAGARARGDRLSVVGSARKLPATGFNLQVGLFRASETRDGHRERAAACSLTGNSQFPANSAISCRVCPLCNPACGDAIFRPPFSQQRHRARAGRPSCCGVERDRDRERERESTSAWLARMQPNRSNEFDECGGGGAFQ